VLFGGGDIPMTLVTSWKSIRQGEHNAVKGTAHDPGKQDSGLDWNYRLPLLRVGSRFMAMLLLGPT